MTPDLPPCRWDLPDPEQADESGLVGVGADLEPGTLLAAYRKGLFPMPVDAVLGWWSPDPRGVIPVEGMHVSRSLRAACRRFEFRVNGDFAAVIRKCASVDRPGGWINAEIIDAYVRLNELGWAHSFESWTAAGELAGGMYGIGIGRFFAGESMYHEATDASKVALVGAVGALRSAGVELFDVQWSTPHLESLGARCIPRAKYLELLHSATAEPTKLERLQL